MVETKSRRSKEKKPKQPSRGSPVAFLKDLATNRIIPFTVKGGRNKEETSNNVTIDQQDNTMVLTGATPKKAPPSGDRKLPPKKKSPFKTIHEEEGETPYVAEVTPDAPGIFPLPPNQQH